MQYSRIQNTFITYQASDVFSVDGSKSPAVNWTLVEKKQVQLNSNIKTACEGALLYLIT